MAASKNSKPAADAVAITDVDPEDIAEAIAALEGPVKETLAHGTIRETNTVYEDRTVNPAVDREVEYEAVVEELDGGTVLTSYTSEVE
jgi:hypothetical protein